jgi:GH35 family endo-1,4-beta-xylanase
VAVLLGTVLPLTLPLPGRAACRHGPATLRCAARRAHVRVGVGYTYQPEKPDEAALVTREFDALTLEGELLWSVVHPEATRWNFAPADRAVAWAARPRTLRHRHPFRVGPNRLREYARVGQSDR